MALFVFSNNNRTVLAAPIGPSATSITLAPGTGAKFPNPSAGQHFAVTLNDAATRLVYEIVYCTARSGDVLTVVRGQESTTPLSWTIGDFVWNGPTAGQMAALIQAEQITNDTLTPWFAATKVDSLDVVGNSAIGGTETVQGGGPGSSSIQAITGNIVADAGHLRAALGARGYGDAGAAVILGDYAGSIPPLGSTWLLIRPDGLIMQGGDYTVGLAPGASVTITLPLAFPTGPIINPLVTIDASAASVAAEIAAGRVLSAAGNNLSNAQITISNASSLGSASNYDFTYLTMGY